MSVLGHCLVLVRCALVGAPLRQPKSRTPTVGRLVCVQYRSRSITLFEQLYKTLVSIVSKNVLVGIRPGAQVVDQNADPVDPPEGAASRACGESR